MTVYLGTLGRMIPIYSTPSAQIETEERYSFSTTLEGRRKAQARPIGRRTWGLNAQFADPAEHSLLSQFANGAWGNGPFWFLSADALITNILPPDVVSSSSRAVTYSSTVLEGGPVETPDGWSARSILNTSPATILQITDQLPVPVLPGGQVTVAAYVSGASSAVRLYFYNAAGTQISAWSSTVTGSVGVMTRSYRTITVPSNAVSVMLAAQNTVQACWPSITWSDGLLPFGDGQGCAKAVVHGFSRDQVLAAPGSTYSNVSFTVSEVG